MNLRQRIDELLKEHECYRAVSQKWLDDEAKKVAEKITERLTRN